jgi:hypothetical protein
MAYAHDLCSTDAWCPELRNTSFAMSFVVSARRNVVCSMRLPGHVARYPRAKLLGLQRPPPRLTRLAVRVVC